jgi:hypothetical protein
VPIALKMRDSYHIEARRVRDAKTIGDAEVAAPVYKGVEYRGSGVS